MSTATASTSANQNVRSAGRPPKTSEKESLPLHIQLQDLDIQVRRTGRLDSDQVDKLLKAMTGERCIRVFLEFDDAHHLMMPTIRSP